MTVGTPPLEIDTGFVVATGIECSAPVIEGGVRQDELRKTGHWERYRERPGAGRLVRNPLPAIRGALPRRRPRPGSQSLRLGLDRSCDGGVAGRGARADPRPAPLWPPRRHRRGRRPPAVVPIRGYAAAVAERYPWVRYYTPVNEPFVTAWFSAKEGYWNERRQDDVSFVAALDNILHCVVRGMELISERRPDAIFIQSDACDSYTTTEPETEEHARLLTERSWVGYDLTYGREPTQRVLDWLYSNGMTSQRLEWFAAHGTSERCIIGHDYYRGNERVVDGAGRIRPAGPHRRGFKALALDFYDRYRMPLMLTETNMEGADAPEWLAEVWNDTIDLKDQGLPIRGFCWYGFIDHVDWDTALTANRGKVNTCGLVGLDRQPHEVGHLYRQLAASGASRLLVG